MSLFKRWKERRGGVMPWWTIFVIPLLMVVDPFLRLWAWLTGADKID